MLNCDTSVCDCLQRNMNSFKLGMINHCNCNSAPVKCVKSKKKKPLSNVMPCLHETHLPEVN